jgi:acetoacetate decarboxylase
MSKVRWVKSDDEIRAAEAANPEFLPSTLQQIRAVYATDPEIVATVLPKPLEPSGNGEVGITISKVSMHMAPGFDVEIGAALLGVKATYEGTEGLYLLTMPMTTEGAVIGGREVYGEPKKIADIAFTREGDTVTTSVTRQGVPYIEVRGTVGTALGPRAFTEHAYCFKCLPALDRSETFEFDPLLVRLEWQHTLERVDEFDGEITLRESPFDPVVDLPVRRIVSMTYEEGGTKSNGTVLRSVPGEWLRPFLHTRYDDVAGMLAAMSDRSEATAEHA